MLSSTTWTSSGSVGDDEFDAVYVPLGAVHRLLNLSKAEHDHDDVEVGRRNDARVEGRDGAPAHAASDCRSRS